MRALLLRSGCTKHQVDAGIYKKLPVSECFCRSETGYRRLSSACLILVGRS